MPPPPAAPSVANPRKRSSSASPQGPSARSEKLARTQTVPASLGEFVRRDVELLQRLGWTKFADTHTHSIVSQAALNHLLYTESRPNTHTIWDSTPLQRDPCLPSATTPLSYIDIFVDDFVGLAQAPARAPDNARRVRRILLHAIDDVFRPLEAGEETIRAEPVSLKKLKQGDCSWSTIKLVLGWIIDTTTMTIHLPPHRVERLWEILHSIPPDQKRTSVKKWYAILGELRSMSLALPGSRNMFSRLQNALTLKSGARVNLNKGVHQALDDFWWMARDITSWPARIAELVPLSPVSRGPS